MPPTPGAPATGPPAKPLEAAGWDCCPGGGPCLDKEKAFILAWMSEVRPLARVGGGPGRRAAFVGPSGAEEEVMVEVVGLEGLPNDGAL